MSEIYKRIVPVFLLGICASTGGAAQLEGHSGSWHSVESRTWWSDGALPKGFSLTLNLEFAAGRFVYRSANDTDKSKPPSGIEFATTLDGSIQPAADQQANGYDQISFQQTSPSEFRMLRFLHGELTAAQFWSFSADGKELVRRGSTKTPQGPWHAYEEWFVRQ